MKISVDLVPDESPLGNLYTAYLPCLKGTVEGECSVLSSSYKDTNTNMGAPPS